MVEVYFCSQLSNSRWSLQQETFKECLLYSVVAMRSRKQTHSEGQCRQWSAVYYTGGPKAESPLSQGPRPAFVKIFYTPCVCVRTHHSKFLETYIKQGKYNLNNPIIHVLCAHVLKQSNNQPIINKSEVTLQQIQKKLMACLEEGVISVCFLLGDE